MTEWVSYAEAADILGCHVSNIAKLVRKEELTSRGKRGASFSRGEVGAMAQRRTQELGTRAARPSRRYKRVEHRRDHDNEWLSPLQVAKLLGVTRSAVIGRIAR